MLALMFNVMPNTSQHWRRRAEHAWVMTDLLRGPSAKLAMIKLAMTYETLGVRTAQREIAEKLARDADQ